MREGVAVDDLGELDPDVVEDAASCMREIPAGLPAACATPRVTTSSAIRALTVDELPRLVALGPAFVAEFHGWREGFAGESFVEKWRRLYASGAGIVFGWFVNEDLVGVIGGIAFNDFYDDRPCVADMGWFVDAAHRSGSGSLRLLRQLEAWAREKQGLGVRLTFARLVQPGQTEIVSYSKMGYEPREISYGKRLD